MKLVSPFAGKIQHGDEVAFQVLGKNLKYLQCKETYRRFLGFRYRSYYYISSTGPGLFMNSNDWESHPNATFQIYRRAGEVVAIYVPQQKKWMKCGSTWCQTNTCPGNPTTTHGMANDAKQHTCPQNVFKIYARGRELGESLKANDEILLYTLQYGKWVSETNSSSNWLGQRTCPGSHRPPASSKYDTCYDAVFELWKQ